MELTIGQIEFLKAGIDAAILVNCDEFEYPCYFSWPEIPEEEIEDLNQKGLIGWHDGWHITKEGEAAYHANKERLPYYQFLEHRKNKIKEKNHAEIRKGK